MGLHDMSISIDPTADVKTVQIGSGTAIWQYCVVLEGARLGTDCNVNAHCFIENDVIIGNRVTVKCGVYIWDGIELEDDVFVGPNVTFTNDKYPRSKVHPDRFSKTVIKKGASIGAGAILLPGLTIGEGATVGAGAVVTKDVQPGSIVIGNPAREMTSRLVTKGRGGETTIRVADYSAEMRQSWDDFVKRSKNGTFLFQRGFMEYHSDRFVDASIVVYDRKGQIIALLPSSQNVEAGVIRSHGGLTYGGFITDHRMSAPLMLDVFSAVLEHYGGRGAKELLYKPVPHIYHKMGAEEDLYALFRHGAELFRRDVSAAVFQECRAPVSKGRRLAIKLGQKNNIVVGESTDWTAFMAMQEALLLDKFGVRPVHTAEEMHFLHAEFPDQIRMFTATQDGELCGGAIIFDCDPCVHVQYIASTPHGRNVGALDVVFDHLIGQVYRNRRWFDFGTSTTSEGTVLNTGLAENKEGWGARSVVYDHYKITI